MVILRTTLGENAYYVNMGVVKLIYCSGYLELAVLLCTLYYCGFQADKIVTHSEQDFFKTGIFQQLPITFQYSYALGLKIILFSTVKINNIV